MEKEMAQAADAATAAAEAAAPGRDSGVALAVATAVVPVGEETRVLAMEKDSARAEAAEGTRAADSGPEEYASAPHVVTRRLTHRARNVLR